MYLDSEGTVPELPQPASGIAVYDLVVEGEVPRERALDVRSAHLSSKPEAKRRTDRCGDVSRAVWTGADKRVCADGKLLDYDLANDPVEAAPRAVSMSDDHDFMKAVERLETLNWSESNAASVAEQLEALGYIE